MQDGYDAYPNAGNNKFMNLYTFTEAAEILGYSHGSVIRNMIKRGRPPIKPFKKSKLWLLDEEQMDILRNYKATQGRQSGNNER